MVFNDRLYIQLYTQYNKYIYIMHKPIILIIAICLSTVSCWWEIGHMAVSQIAEKRLT